MKEAGNLCSEISENLLHVLPFAPPVGEGCFIRPHGLAMSQGQNKELS